jgi:hypothetical protein
MRALAALIVAGFGVVAFWVAWKKIPERFGHRAVHEEAMKQTKVEVGFRFIKYTEGDNDLTLDWEPAGEGKPPIAYVPSERLWNIEMPDWAKGRREEIMRTIKAETAHMKFVWQEYDGS